MRTASFILVLLVGFGTGMANWPASPDSLPFASRSSLDREAPWVHTRDGWERATWRNRGPAYVPPLHPLTLALFLGLSSLTALVAFPVLNRRPAD